MMIPENYYLSCVNIFGCSTVELNFQVCDGMICGAGNDRPTPLMILDILRHDPSVEAEPLSFESVGEGKINCSTR